MRLCKIILVMLALVALAGCRSERNVTSHEEARWQRAVQDSTAVERVQDKHVETQAGWRPGWLELVCCGVLLVLAVGVVLHLRKLTERWSKRR